MSGCCTRRVSRQSGDRLWDFDLHDGTKVLNQANYAFGDSMLDQAIEPVASLVIQGPQGATLMTGRSWNSVITALQFSLDTFGFGGTGRIEPVGYSRLVVILESRLGGFLFGLFGFVLACRLP